ncbi:MAG: AMP-binding protein [Ignavibacteria bacterium]|nr:AMP-binding protein [Ignavibacteria bacterium]
MQADDNWLCPVPLYHVGGVSAVLRCADAGTCVTLADGADAAELLRVFRDERVTLASLVPTVLRRLLDADAAFSGTSLPALRAILLGGGPADSRLLDDAARRALPVLSTYGLTEAASQVATMPLADAARKRGAAGRPLQGVRVSIRDDAGDVLPPGERGTIWISGANVINAYLDGRSPERFADGFFNTGDIGRMDEEDFLWVEARREDLILSGGENVIPAEVENALLAHPAVREACVVGLADAEWGQRVAAALVLGEPDADIRNIEAHCRSLLAGYKIPKRWRVVDALPKNDSGKVLRAAVAALFPDGV